MEREDTRHLVHQPNERQVARIPTISTPSLTGTHSLTPSDLRATVLPFILKMFLHQQAPFLHEQEHVWQGIQETLLQVLFSPYEL